MRILSLALALVVGGAVFVAGQKPTKPTRTLATATFRCPSSDSACPDAIQGDGVPLMGNASNHGGANITSGGVLKIQLSASTTPGRFLSLAFPVPSDVPPCQPSTCRKDFTTANVTSVDAFWVHPLAADGSSDLAGGFNSVGVGQTVDARLKFNFQHPDADVIFTLWYAAASHAGSTDVEVTRLAENEWTVTAPEGNQARLTAFNQRGKLVTTDEGLYTMPFSVHVTVP